MTSLDGILGGALPAYGIYAAATGFVAVAALEAHFWRRLTETLGVQGSREDLEQAFARRTAEEWQAWAQQHDLPIAALLTP
jgi:crotonobetainyl-CoA:carnitine CoA-transferase CaiB-like acyl-CoA transferase